MTRDTTQFSAKFDAIHAIGNPTDAPVARVRDVLICATSDDVTVAMEEVYAHPPIASPIELRLTGASEPVHLGRRVYIDRLSNDDVELVMNACSPRGHYFAPIRQFGQRYSFIRNVEREEWKRHPFRWDETGVLWDALSLSRLVRDNGYSTEYAARITDYEDGEQRVVPNYSSESRFAYRLRHDREWLDPTEGAELRALLLAYWSVSDELPRRITRAMWRTEYASWMRWADLARPIIVGGLEALLKTETHPATRQFTTRVPALAAEVGVDEVTDELCFRLYDARSDWVHGARVLLFTETAQDADEEGPADDAQARALADVARLQDVLRAGVRRCVEDEDFRAIFADDDAIRARWPVAMR